MTPDVALRRICRELDADVPAGFARTGHRWVRTLHGGITHSIDVRPVSGFRGAPVKVLRFGASVGLVSDTRDALRPWIIVQREGLSSGGDVEWVLERDCDDLLVEQTVESMRRRLPDLFEYLDARADPAPFLALQRPYAESTLRDAVSLQAVDVIGEWLRQPCPPVEVVRDAATGWSQLGFADAVLEAHAALRAPLDPRWRGHIEAALRAADGVTWPSVLPWADRVARRVADDEGGSVVAFDPDPRPVVKLRR